MIYLLIGFGSALGGMMRYWCSIHITTFLGHNFPWDIIIINVIGSFVIGLAAAMSGPDSKWALDFETKQFLMVGICGGYTTFSSFSLQTMNLLHDGKMLQASGNIILSVIFCLISVKLGYSLTSYINHVR